MNILALDTCLGAISVAIRWRVASGAWQLVSAHETCATGHAERLLPMIEAVAGQSPLALRDMQRIAVTVGPGTFTGVRTGVAAARALALATGGTVVGLTSLAALRLVVREQSRPEACPMPLAIAIDARRGEFYFEAPGLSGDGPGAGGARLLDAEAAAASLPVTGCRIAGSGAARIAEIARARGCMCDVIPVLEPDARLIALAAETLPILDVVEPLYLRPADAKPPAGASLPRLRENP